jgi:hypothetical protein
MEGKSALLYKTLVLGVIVLFVGLWIQPAIASIQSEESDLDYINIISEFSGLRGKHTVKMSQQEIEELDAFFDFIYMKLKNSESDEQTSIIIDEAINELNKYDLLCDLSVEQVKRKFLQNNKMDIDLEYLPAKKNSNCFIVGRTTETYFFSPLFFPLYTLMTSNNFFAFLFLGYNFFRVFAMMVGFPFFPIQLGSTITFGRYFSFMNEGGLYHSDGWIVTNGENGTIDWNGRILGSIDTFNYFIGRLYIGVEGFFGLKIMNPTTDKTTFLGYSNNVRIQYS